MLWRTKSYLRRLLMVIEPMRARGLGFLSVVFVHAPVAVLLRGWRVIAQPLNGGLIQRLFNQPRFVSFQDKLGASTLPRFYVIVMPFTLHFLLPCLTLLQGRAQIVLLLNGARRWEQCWLVERFPEYPTFELTALPISSVAHGDILTLLLENHRGNFGVIDHDCYVFDEAVFDQLIFAEDECVLSLFSEDSQSVGMTFPLTFFLYFNAEALRQLMHRYEVDAGQYREIPVTAREAMARIGLGPKTYWKSYHNFRDTLHVLLAVAVSDGMKFRFLSSDEKLPAMHVGGTSIGTHHTKNLFALYTHLRFLELLDDPLVRRKYEFLTYPLRSSAQALALGDQSAPEWQTFEIAVTLLQKLRGVLTKTSFGS